LKETEIVHKDLFLLLFFDKYKGHDSETEKPKVIIILLFVNISDVKILNNIFIKS
jgi:hypothetical protein